MNHPPESPALTAGVGLRLQFHAVAVGLGIDARLLRQNVPPLFRKTVQYSVSRKEFRLSGCCMYRKNCSFKRVPKFSLTFSFACFNLPQLSCSVVVFDRFPSRMIRYTAVMENELQSPSPFCPFCALLPSNIIMGNSHAVAVLDGFPVSPGHMLIIPRRHIVSLFHASEEERNTMFSLVSNVRELLVQERNPDGFNIGINDGGAAGQTVMHLHIHLIPRYIGDTCDPRGGVRWIFPDKAAYWADREKP